MNVLLNNFRNLFRLSVIVGILFISNGCSLLPLYHQKSLVKPNVRIDKIYRLLEEHPTGYVPNERAQPVVANDMIYQGSISYGMVALDYSTGSKNWDFKIDQGVESTPLVHDTHLYFGANDGYFYCLNSESGEVVWKYNVRKEIVSAPSLDQGMIFFVSTDNTVYALDAKTGKWIWSYNRGYDNALSVRGNSSPVVFDHHLYVGFSDGYIVSLLKLDGKLIWEKKINFNAKFYDVSATPYVDEEIVIIPSYDASLHCLKRKDGSKKWELPSGSAVNVTVENDKIYFASFTEKAIISISKQSGTMLWKYEIKNGIPTAASVMRDYLVFGSSEDYIYVINKNSGEFIWKFNPGKGVYSTPLISDDTTALVVSNYANIYRIKIEN